jgi:hypothetical protein
MNNVPHGEQKCCSIIELESKCLNCRDSPKKTSRWPWANAIEMELTGEYDVHFRFQQKYNRLNTAVEQWPNRAIFQELRTNWGKEDANSIDLHR